MILALVYVLLMAHLMLMNGLPSSKQPRLEDQEDNLGLLCGTTEGPLWYDSHLLVHIFSCFAKFVFDMHNFCVKEDINSIYLILMSLKY